MMSNKLKILLTGNSGFIGTNLGNHLIKNGHLVEGISRKKIIREYPVHQSDLQNSSFFKKIKLKTNFDTIIHCASITEEKDIGTMIMNNVLSTLNILNFCKQNHIKKFILISGHNVYAQNSRNPKNENSKIMPSTNYGLTKLMQENLAKFYAENHSINVTILRLSYVYGLKQSPEKLIPTLIQKYVNSKPIELHNYKNGFQKIDIINIHDVCKAIDKTLKINKNLEIFNISYGESITVKDILKILKQNISSNSIISIKKINKNTSHYVYDNTHAKKLLTFSPTISLEQGIKEIIKNCY